MTEAGSSCGVTVFDETEGERYCCELERDHVGTLHSQDDGLVTWWDSDPDSVTYAAP